MPRKPVQKLKQIASDDEMSDSGPDVSDVSEYEDEEEVEYEVGKVDGRDDESDYSDMEYESKVEYSNPIESKDAWSKGQFIGTDISERKRRKEKRDERLEREKLEEEDADERIQEYHKLLQTYEDQSDEDSEEDVVADETEVTSEGRSKEENIKLLKRQSPEFFPLLKELRLYKAELDDVLEPLQKIFNDEDDERFVDYITSRTNVLRTYCANIVFYIRLRAKASPALADHPVHDRLAQLKKIIINITKERTQDYAQAYLDVYQTKRSSKKADIEDNTMENDDENQDALADFEAMTEGGKRKRNTVDQSDSEDDYESDGKGGRKITYKMQKNKGMLIKRQKKRRNPRVKHRVAYREALIRRKGAVREVRKEVKKYSGEASGIKAGLKKSVRIRS